MNGQFQNSFCVLSHILPTLTKIGFWKKTVDVIVFVGEQYWDYNPAVP